MTQNVCRLNLHNFKHVANTYGHLNGSQVLKEVAETLKECLIEPLFGVAYDVTIFRTFFLGFDSINAAVCKGIPRLSSGEKIISEVDLIPGQFELDHAKRTS